MTIYIIWLLTGNRNTFKSSNVRVAVVKKPAVAEGKKPAEPEDKKQLGEEEVQNSKIPNEKKQEGENKTSATTNVLQSLCQNYDSDDSDE